MFLDGMLLQNTDHTPCTYVVFDQNELTCVMQDGQTVRNTDHTPCTCRVSL